MPLRRVRRRGPTRWPKPTAMAATAVATTMSTAIGKNSAGMGTSRGCRMPQGIRKRPSYIYAYILSQAAGSGQVIPQVAATRRVAKLAQRLGLNLPYSLASDVEVLAYFFQGVVLAIQQSEAHLQDLAFALGQHRKRVLHLILEKFTRRRVHRLGHSFVLDEVAELARLLRANRRLERHRLLSDADNPPDFGRRSAPLALQPRVQWLVRSQCLENRRLVLRFEQIHFQSQFFGGRLPPQVLDKPPLDSHEPIDRLYHVDRNTDCARLVGDGAADGLADPPRGVRAELVPFRRVELLHRAQKSNVTLLNQVQEGDAAPHVPFRYADDKSQIRTNERSLGLLRKLLDQIGLFLQSILLRQPALIRATQGKSLALGQPLGETELHRRRQKVENDEAVKCVPRDFLPCRFDPPQPIVQPGAQI